ncbi:2464_t:CDS:1, partial [Dentiscutata erythropus]
YSIPVSCLKADHVLTPKALSNSAPLLIYSAPVIPDSYIPNNKRG